MDDTAIATTLGLDSAYGYHVEEEPRLPITISERPSTPWYPCIETDHTYTGCLGEACPLEICWTGGASTSYAAALRRRFHPTDAEYAAGACCLRCRHVQEITIAAIDARRGLVHLPMLQCGQRCWQHPISAAAFVRRRIPAAGDLDLADCPLFEQAVQPIAAVERQRRHINEQTRARRAAGEKGQERQHG